MSDITPEKRKELFVYYLQHYLSAGYVIRWQQDYSAQLEGPKQFSWILAIALLLLCIIPFIIYLFSWSSGTGHMLQIAIAEDGRVYLNGQEWTGEAR